MRDKREYEVPESQFRERLEKVRDFADSNYLSAVVVYSAPEIHQWAQSGHVGYLTNWSNLDRLVETMVVVPRQGEPALLFAGVEYMLGQIDQVAWMTDVRMVSSPDPRQVSSSYDVDVGGDMAGGAKTFGGATADIIEATGSGGKPIAIAGREQIPMVFYKDLESSIAEGIADAPDIVAELRAIKSPEEVSVLRQVAAVSDRCYAAMLEALEDGIWGYELSAAMDSAGKRVGADFVYNTLHNAPGGRSTRATCPSSHTPIACTPATTSTPTRTSSTRATGSSRRAAARSASRSRPARAWSSAIWRRSRRCWRRSSRGCRSAS